MAPLHHRSWLPTHAEARIEEITASLAGLDSAGLFARLTELVDENHRLHDRSAFNLNPASNVMNPRAEALLSAGLGSRASLGHAGDKYETGLEAIEQIEVMAADLACRVFDAHDAEVRVPSGAISNLYVFMATCTPGDTIIAPPPSIGGHVTHHAAGAAGLYGLTTVAAPVDAARYTIDVDALRRAAREARPALITVGGSMNLEPHPVSAVRAVCDEVGAMLMFDAAHLCGMIAGRAWPNPLDEGADALTMSTYKSLGGPPSGLIVTRSAELAERLDQIAYPGLTANADPGRIAALACTLLDWVDHGAAYATAMVETAQALAEALLANGVPVFRTTAGPTMSHQLAVIAAPYGGGQRAAALLGQAGLLCCGIGLPIEPVDGDTNGLRLGTPEIVRLGLAAGDMARLAAMIARVLHDPASAAAVRAEITEWRASLGPLQFVNA